MLGIIECYRKYPLCRARHNGHFFHFFRIGYKPRVHFFTALINGGDHQHHELHGISPLVLFVLHSSSSLDMLAKQFGARSTCIALTLRTRFTPRPLSARAPVNAMRSSLACIVLHSFPLITDAHFVGRIDGDVNIRSLRQLRVNHHGITLRGLRLAISLWGRDDHTNRLPNIGLSKRSRHVLNRAHAFRQLAQPTLLSAGEPMKQLGPSRLRCSTAAERTMVNHHLRLAARARAVNEVILVELRVKANGRIQVIGLPLQEPALAWRYSVVWHGDALLQVND